MTNCKHCGMSIVKYINTGNCDIIGEDDNWVHAEDQNTMTKHLAQPDWKDER